MPFKFGRRAPIAIGPHVKFAHLVDMAKLPPIPGSCDYTVKAERALSLVYLNDTLGDCVPAEMCHTGGVVTANAGSTEITFANAAVEYLYKAIGGWSGNMNDPGPGCDLQTALNFWMRHGLLPFSANKHKIDMWVAVDATNMTEVLAALYLFESLMPGIALPDAWVSNMDNMRTGDIWDLAGPPDPNNGHCPGFFGYLSNGNLLTSTWGMILQTTGRAVQYYCAAQQGGELYAPLYPDAISRATQRAPNGFDFAMLENLMKAMAA